MPKSPAKKSRPAFLNPIKWVRASRKRFLITVILIVALLGASALAYIQLRDGSRQTINPPSQSEQNAPIVNSSKTLRIESSLAGVDMKGSPFCDSQEASQKTPYDCALPGDQIETTVIAPLQVTQDSKTFTFVTWDGCSESNPDKKICKVIFSDDQQKSIKATYEEKKPAQAQTPTPKPQQPSASTSPCISTPETETTVSCTVHVAHSQGTETQLVVRGFPATQSGAYGYALGSPITIKCAVTDSCNFQGTPFTEKTDTFTPNGYYSGAFAITVNASTDVMITIPKSLNTSYKTPFCKGCATEITNHTFNHWGVREYQTPKPGTSDSYQIVDATTYFISKKQ